MAGPHRERTGTEPLTARSALRLRLLLSCAFLPVFVAGGALFWYAAQRSGPLSVPSANSLRVLAVTCCALALFALVDLLVVLRRRRRERPPGRRPQDFR